MWVLWQLVIVVLMHRVVGQMDSTSPECAIRCWENTKYRSKCLDDVKCLCSEPGYQNSVFQCLYSQCDTSHFGSALHHAIAQCFGLGNELTFAMPPIANREALRRREAEYAAGTKLVGSGSAADYYPTESADYVGFPTQSVQYATESGGQYSPSPSPTSSSSFSPLVTASPAFTTDVASERSFSPVSTLNSSSNAEQFVASASASRPEIRTLGTLMGLYFFVWWILRQYVL